MKKLLMSIVFIGVLFTGKAQTDSVAVQEKSTPAYFKHGLGFAGVYSLGYGLSYRHFITNKFGVQGLFDFESDTFFKTETRNNKFNYGLALLYNLHRGHRMSYSIYQANRFERRQSGFYRTRFSSGLGVMAEVRIQDRVALGLMTDVLYDFLVKKVDASILGVSFLYNF